MLNWLKKKVAPKNAAMPIQAHPLTTNPSSEQKVQRTMIRLQRYKQARDSSSDAAYKAKMNEAIIRATSALRASGITVEE